MLTWCKIPSVDLVDNQPPPPKRPLVVDPESVLAEQTDVVQDEDEKIDDVQNDDDRSELENLSAPDASPLPWPRS